MMPVHEHDPQQVAISTQDRNVIVVAGAGSGKTYVLVERFIALLEQHPVSALVAITFTNKAAREMRERVRLRLDEKGTGAASEAERRLWTDRLGAMDSARISTIHALCTSILRASAAEAQIDPDFDVLEEDAARLLREDALDRALSALVEMSDPALALFAEYDDYALRRQLLEGMTGDPLALPDDIMAAWLALWDEHAERLITGLSFKGFLALNGQNIPAGDKLGAHWLDTAQRLRHLPTAKTLTEKIALLRPIAEIRLNVGSEKAWGSSEALKAAKEALKSVRDPIQQTLKDMGEPPTGELDQRAADLLPLWERLLETGRAHYAAMKRDRAALDFDDLERLTRALLHDPEVQARYRAEFAHLLVDEFQDTNRAQYEIVTALARPGSLFMVGDPKQSIYGFRGADVTVFEAAQASVEASSGTVVTLSRSFRTHSRLVEWFNTLFANILVRQTPDAAYQVKFGTPMSAYRPTEGELPFIALEIGVYPARSEDNEDDRADGVRRREAARIAVWIAALLESKRPIYDKRMKAYRPVEAGDIALLFRRMTRVTLYEEAFKDAGLPYVTVSGRGYYDRQEVWDVLNLLRALYAPSDGLALASALKSPLFNLSDDALLALAQSGGASLWDALMNPPEALAADTAFAAGVLRDLRGRAGRVTIAALLRDALAHTGYLAALTALPDGARRRANVEKLLDKARDGGKITLGAFTRYLGDLSELEVREGEAALDAAAAIRLMTVHASKGLEFPVVVLADSGADTKGRDSALLVYDPPGCKVYDLTEDKLVAPAAFVMAQTYAKARDDAEARRLFYVAATRTADLLLISGQVTETKDGLSAKGWLAWLFEQFDLNKARVGETRAIPGGTASFHDATLDLPHPPPAAPAAPPQADDPMYPPPLLATVSAPRSSFVRSLTATELADLGCAFDAEESERGYYRERWRRGVLRAVPHRLETIRDAGRRKTARVVGEMVHRALRWWRLDTYSDEMRRSLDAYAWELGMIDDDARAAAAAEAWTRLEQVISSELYQRIRRALEHHQPVYREIPFVYRTEQRQINGVIDVLFRTTEGRWQIVDYKTADLSHYPDTYPPQRHARRYWLQVGVYAAAAAQLLEGMNLTNPIPEVYIHYIRHNATVRIDKEEWQGALARLEPCIGELIEDDK